MAHGCVRNPDGTLSTIDSPAVCQTSNGTFATGIDPTGLVVGVYSDPSCSDFHGFARSPHGTFTTIDFPGATDTEIDAVSPSGAMSGAYFTSSGINGFLRSPDGTFTTYSTPANSG